MNIDVIKKPGNGKLIVDDGLLHDDYDEKAYEMKMLTGNEIPVFLSFKKSYEDEKEVYVYDVTSMTSLQDLTRIQQLKIQELKLLVESLDECRKAVCEYLLSSEGVILDPEYVFFDRSTKKIKYCFFPWNDTDVFSSYQKIGEFLLSAIDYSDSSAVDAAYEIYASILNKDYELSKYVSVSEDSLVEDVANNNYSIDDNEYRNPPDSLRNTPGSLLRNDMPEQDTTYERDTSYARDANLHLSTVSIICLTTFVIIIIILICLLLYSRRLFLTLFCNTRIMVIGVLVASFLLYFPIMNFSDINRLKRVMRMREYSNN